MYQVPEEFYHRLHHVRPRFKSNVEEVLLCVAGSIASIGELSKQDFKEFLNQAIYRFPGNQTLKLKTVQNWRTEISALFSLFYDEGEKSKASPLARDLSEDQDLPKFFKYFLYTFQYPGGHIKAKESKELLQKNVLFHPANYILRVIRELAQKEKKQAYLTKNEACHMIFNDLRATRDFRYEKVSEVAERILENRKQEVEYDSTGDVVRYAGDILDYMALANLLKNYAGKYFANSSEKRALRQFLQNTNYFLYQDGEVAEVSSQEKEWVLFATKPVEENVFDTDILAFIASDEKEYEQLLERTRYLQAAEVPGSGSGTKEIGDYGENLVHGHECMSLKEQGREDLIHWVKCIPNHFAVGYDIQSVDASEMKKYIEVKSTISSRRLTFQRFHLTRNELSSAQSLGGNYYVYRLQINGREDGGKEVKLVVIRNPIQLFKENQIEIDLSTGEVNLKSYQGEEVQLLEWKK